MYMYACMCVYLEMAHFLSMCTKTPGSYVLRNLLLLLEKWKAISLNAAYTQHFHLIHYSSI